MRKVLLLILVLLLALPMAIQAQDDLTDLEGQVITIAVENAYPPFNYLDEATGDAVGWDYDTVAEICVRINCTPEFIETSWDGMIVAVAGGEFD
ncbi:MAG: transporter substrate-binding domain-containing protein, partial [Anaerolineae bacterium]|nr:transporter substrate-binding domain-containing protein [Anaerolineae bacterium]